MTFWRALNMESEKKDTSEPTPTPEDSPMPSPKPALHGRRRKANQHLQTFQVQTLQAKAWSLEAKARSRKALAMYRAYRYHIYDINSVYGLRRRSAIRAGVHSTETEEEEDEEEDERAEETDLNQDDNEDETKGPNSTDGNSHEESKVFPRRDPRLAAFFDWEDSNTIDLTNTSTDSQNTHQSTETIDVDTVPVPPVNLAEFIRRLELPLNKKEQDIYEAAMNSTESVGQVQASSMQTLKANQWVGDEIGAAVMAQLNKANQEEIPRCFFFDSTFMNKLREVGKNGNPETGRGMHDPVGLDYDGVKQWSKRVPGEDIFQLDELCFLINQRNQHWLFAVAKMQEKSIAIYDSLWSEEMHHRDHQDYAKAIKHYLKQEDKDKHHGKRGFLDWQFVRSENVPQQRNGNDCCVYACLFALMTYLDFPLEDEDTQRRITQDFIDTFRQRLAISIKEGKLPGFKYETHPGEHQKQDPQSGESKPISKRCIKKRPLEDVEENHNLSEDENAPVLKRGEEIPLKRMPYQSHHVG